MANSSNKTDGMAGRSLQRSYTKYRVVVNEVGFFEEKFVRALAVIGSSTKPRRIIKLAD